MRQRLQTLNREPVLMRLERGIDAVLSLLHAPAGYGKSTMLSIWRKKLLERGHRVCWLSVGVEDNDVQQLLIYLLFSLHENDLDFGAGDNRIEPRLSEASTRELLSVILHIVSEQHEKVILVIDDFENLAQPCVDEVIAPLLKHAPENLHVAIATRDDSRLRVADLEARGEALRFNASQLRFSRAEIEALFGPNFRPHTIDQVDALTEGWPMVVHMLCSAAGREHDIGRLLLGLRGEAGTFTAYLSEEVISNLAPAVIEFLMDIAIVDRIDLSLADHLRDDDSTALFVEAQGLDALLAPVDSSGPSYRLHPAFREHLLERLHRNDPARAVAMHARAAQWFFDKGDLVECVRHWIRAGQPERAVLAVQEAGGLFIWPQEGLSRLRLIMGLFDERFVLRSPLLAMIQCLLLVKRGKVYEARKLFDATVAAPAPQADTGPAARQLARDRLLMGTFLSIYEGREIDDRVCEKLEAAMDRLDAGRNLVIVAQYCTILCVAYLQRGHFPKARRFAERGLAAFFAGGSSFGALYLYFHLGDISLSEGAPGEAAAFYEQATELARKHFSDDEDIKLVSSIMLSELDHETGRATPNYRNLAQVPIQLERHEAWFDSYAAGYRTAALVEYQRYGLDAALSIAERGLDYARWHGMDALSRLLAGLRAELFLKAGRVEEAHAALQSADLTVDRYRVGARARVACRERFVVVPAMLRLLVEEGRLDEALRHLNAFLEQAREAGHERFRLTLAVLGAVSCCRGDRAAEANGYLEEALILYRASGILRDFLEDSVVIASALAGFLSEEAATTAEVVGAARELARRLELAPGLQDETEPLLSDREKEVLRHLSQGDSNKVIGRKLDVSDSTIRFHLRNIFVKLKVKSRVQAVTVAQRRGLI